MRPGYLNFGEANLFLRSRSKQLSKKGKLPIKSIRPAPVSLYIRSSVGEVKSEPVGAAETIHRVAYGQALTPTGVTRGSWIQVYVPGGTGWIWNVTTQNTRPTDNPTLKPQDGTPLKGDDVAAGSKIRG